MGRLENLNTVPLHILERWSSFKFPPSTQRDEAISRHFETEWDLPGGLTFEEIEGVLYDRALVMFVTQGFSGQDENGQAYFRNNEKTQKENGKLNLEQRHNKVCEEESDMYCEMLDQGTNLAQFQIHQINEVRRERRQLSFALQCIKSDLNEIHSDQETL